MARPLRYTFILVLFALGITLAAVGGWRYARASAPVPGPIILISIDTLRADRLPAYGYRGIKTPAIDALARDGIVFERAYSHSPQTLPSHVSMLTGRLPFETGVRDDETGALKPGERMLAQMLRDRGYATGGIVSSGALRRATGFAQGFDFFEDDMSAGVAELTAGQRSRAGAESEAIAEHWLDAVGTTRLFLFLHVNEPHASIAITARDGASSYDEQVAASDDIVGRFLQYLKKHQLYDQSTIVLVSDHGEGLSEHGEREHGLFLYEENIHVPLIVKQAAGLGAGRRVGDVVQLADLVPTILDLAKAPAPGNLRGRSLKPLTDGTGTLSAIAVYSESGYGRLRFGWSELTSMHDGRFQFIRAPREELYDLKADPHQRASVASAAGEASKRRAALKSALTALLGEDKPADAAPAVDPKDGVDVVESYRRATELIAARQWPQAIDVLQRIARDTSGAAEVWRRLADVAILTERYDLALSAYQQMIEFDSSDPRPLIDAARVSLLSRKLDDAEELATRAIEEAGASGGLLADAHTVLTHVALARRDPDTAREHSIAARKAQPSSVLPLYVDARLLYEEGKVDDALARLEKADAALKKDQVPPLPGLHYLMAETLLWADRPAEAERHLLDELSEFPHNLDARAALATLYQSGGDREQTVAAVDDLVRVTPTPQAYALAAKLWTAFGDQKQAASIRADSRRLFANRRAAH